MYAVNCVIGWKQFESIGTLFFLVPFLLLFALIGLAIFALGINRFFIRGKIHITTNEVTYDKSSLFENKHWIEPLEKYVGILKKKETRTMGAAPRLSHEDSEWIKNCILAVIASPAEKETG